jgi:N-acetylglucosamine-6-sulfatase
MPKRFRRSRSATTTPHVSVLALGLVGILGLGVLAAVDLDSGPIDPSSADGRPNLIVVQTDDQTKASLNRRTMPSTMALLVDRGTSFDDYVVSSPLCCPSRASLLTGQYPHNHGVVSNAGGYASLREKANTLPVWLKRVGYRTAHVGKFLNNYERHASPPNSPPPGWDDWATMLPPYSYFGYELAVNGRRVGYGHERSDYLTTVLNRRASRLIRRYGEQPEPFFLAVDHFAPHGQSEEKEGGCGKTALPLPGDFRRFARERLPTPPSFDEEDVTDKPAFRQLVSRLPDRRIESMRENYRCRLASLRAVDRGVQRIVRALKEVGELEQTVIVFTSDNGFLQGEHRIPAQKAQAYEEAVRVPFVIRAPSWARDGADRRHVSAPVANVDLAPTILDLARAQPCRTFSRCRLLDGRSLTGLLAGRRPQWVSNRGILLTFTNGHRRNARTESCRFNGIRTRRLSYVEHESLPDPGTGECRVGFERELYDLRRDPYQLRNLASGEAPRPFGLAARLARLRDCRGIRGRDQKRAPRPFCE